MKLHGELNQLSEDLDNSPDSLESLKFVLQKISDIRDMPIEVELQYRDIQVLNLDALLLFIDSSLTCYLRNGIGRLECMR